MRSYLPKTTLLALVAMLAACNQGSGGGGSGGRQADAAAIADTINKLEARWGAGLNEKTPAQIAAYYAPDAVVMQSGGPALSGIDQITQAAARTRGDANYKLEFKSQKIDVSDAGDLAYARGTYTLSVTNPTSKQVESASGNYLTVYRKQEDGSWKAVEDIST